MDVVSGGELSRALKAGVKGSDIIYSGVGKTDEEISYAIESKVSCLNVESESELHTINQIASESKTKANISIRVNPDVDAKTHVKITTGKAENKFGIEFNDSARIYKLASSLKNINITGVSIHIGSQITSLEPFKKAFLIIRDLVSQLRNDGHTIDHIDLGGGLGIAYHENETPPSINDYGKLVSSIFEGVGAQIYLEPGRFIIGNSGLLITKVINVKTTPQKSFIIVDAGMNDFIRPTLYGAYHETLPVIDNLGTSSKRYDVVGPVCETGDFFAKNRKMNFVKKGSLIAIKSVGAYGTVQSSNYNSRPIVAEILVNKGQYEIIRHAQKIDDLINLDTVATWLDN
jgi:diaminopimelate decarboxylase